MVTCLAQAQPSALTVPHPPLDPTSLGPYEQRWKVCFFFLYHHGVATVFLETSDNWDHLLWDHLSTEGLGAGGCADVATLTY